MIYKIMFTLLLFVPANVSAQVKYSDITLMSQAVSYSAKADAYNVYCEKDGDLAESFIAKLDSQRKLSQGQYEELVALKAVVFDETALILQEEKYSCKDLEFMMPRLEVMQKLKDVSYLLNGIDPKTTPYPEIPSLEDILPAPKL